MNILKDKTIEDRVDELEALVTILVNDVNRMIDKVQVYLLNEGLRVLKDGKSER